MQYDKIWKKVLGNDEKVEFEFSIGSAAIKFEFAVWIIIGLLFIGFAPVVTFLFLILAIFKVYYLKVANAYAFTNKRVLIHRGWLSTHTISVDYPKITDIHITEPFLERVLMHVGNIAVITAGTTFDQIILRNVETPYEVKKKLDRLKDSFSPSNSKNSDSLPEATQNNNDSEPKKKKCPFCSEMIMEDAKKCRFCGEFLDKANNN